MAGARQGMRDTRLRRKARIAVKRGAGRGPSTRMEWRASLSPVSLRCVCVCVCL